MIVSWDWLQEYVDTGKPASEVAEKLMMTGLNLEGMEEVGSDLAIDLEVTSNRSDCLGHIGVAREAGVCFDAPLRIPPAQPATNGTPVADATSVEIECEDLCPRYIARVIRGVKVGPSPEWLKNRLETLGIASINNIVDVTNYVLMECGQPLHAFDQDRLREDRIVVRRAKDGETIQAIDHKEYKLTSEMCVIADAQQPVAIGGVMGGAATEISDATTNVLIEVADFAPMSIRKTARALKLFSDSSYRFERGINHEQLDWASRRCCELILEVAGGELLDGSIWAGQPVPEAPEPVTLRFAQIPRILGIDVPRDETLRILRELGLEVQGEATGESVTLSVPGWRRRDITREADLIEEVARMYGYDRIPEDAVVPLSLSSKTLRDRVAEHVCQALTASGFYEAITLTMVDPESQKLFNPLGADGPLTIEHSEFSKLCGLRLSIVPSLLESRRANERHGNFDARLFEFSSVFRAVNPGNTDAEPKMIGLVTGQSFSDVKGLLQSVAQRVNPDSTISVRPSDVAQFAPGRGAEVLLNGEFWGWFGELDQSIADQLDLRDAVVVAEVSQTVLEATANLQPQFTELPRFQSVNRDLNFVLDESVTWSQVEDAVTSAAGDFYESIAFSGEYRGKQLPAGKKSYLLTISYRSPERTLTSEEVDESQQSVIAACESSLGAQLR